MVSEDLKDLQWVSWCAGSQKQHSDGSNACSLRYSKGKPRYSLAALKPVTPGVTLSMADRIRYSKDSFRSIAPANTW